MGGKQKSFFRAGDGQGNGVAELELEAPSSSFKLQASIHQASRVTRRKYVPKLRRAQEALLLPLCLRQSERESFVLSLVL